MGHGNSYDKMFFLTYCEHTATVWCSNNCVDVVWIYQYSFFISHSETEQTAVRVQQEITANNNLLTSLQKNKTELIYFTSTAGHNFHETKNW